MNRRIRNVCILVTVTTTILLAGVRSRALAPEKLPTGREVLEKYIEATGGRAAYQKLTSRVTQATMEAPEMGVKGTLTITQVLPTKGRVRTDLQNAGAVEQGFDGNIAWEKSTMMGPRILQGQERDALVRSLTINSELTPEKNYRKMDCTGVETIDGKPAYKVEIESNDGGKETRFYDKGSGLLMKINSIAKTQMGEIQVISTASDYRDVGGIKLPFMSTQEMMQRKVVVTVQKIEHNVAVPASELELPDNVKKLAETQTSQPAATTQPGK